MSKLSAEIATKIESNIESKAGLGDVWNQIDADTKEDIVGEWMDIIDASIHDYGKAVFNRLVGHIKKEK